MYSLNIIRYCVSTIEAHSCIVESLLKHAEALFVRVPGEALAAAAAVAHSAPGPSSLLPFLAPQKAKGLLIMCMIDSDSVNFN